MVRRRGVVALVAMMGLAAVGCGSVAAPSSNSNVITVKISPNPMPTLAIGQSVTLVVTVTGSSRGARLSTASQNITLNAATGVVTCISDGLASVTALSLENFLVGDAALIWCGMFQISNPLQFFTHFNGSDPCPHLVGNLFVTSGWPGPISIAVSVPATLSVQPADASFTLPAGVTRLVPISFTCSTSSSFVATMTLTATDGPTSEVKTVTVNATVR